MSDNKQLVRYTARDLNVNFPDNRHLSEPEKQSTRNAILNGGIVNSEGRAFIDKKEMSKILITDRPGANQVYADMNDEDKFQNGKKRYASASACVKAVTDRIQQDRPQLERERLKDSRECLNAFIDSPQLERERSIQADRIAKELPRLTQRKIKAENVTCDQLTGEPFENDAEGHHIVRKKDNPSKALDLDNIVVTKSKNHDVIHQNNAHGREALRRLADEKGWKKDNI